MTMIEQSTEAGRPAEPTTETLDGVRLRTPVLRFEQVPDGHSRTMPIVVSAPGAGPDHLEVVTPPLAPFSVVRHRFRAAGAAADTRSGSGRVAELWIRYDATSPMAFDRGSIVVTEPASGQRWTVDLIGSGLLADPTEVAGGLS